MDRISTTLRRVAVIALVTSLVLSGVLGIIALLVDDFGDFQARVLITSVTISTASILALSSAASLGRGVTPVLGTSGITAAVAAAIMIFVVTWFDADTDFYLKTMASVITIAVALAHAALLSLARLGARYDRIRVAAYAAIGGLGVALIILYWATPDTDWYVRLVGILSICVAVLTVLVPIFHRINASRGSVRPVPDKVNLASVFAGLTDTWSPTVVAALKSDHVVRAARVQGAYVRHRHRGQDEFFLVLRGSLDIRFEDRTVTLSEGEGLLVPAGVEHQPVAANEAHILLFEPSSTQPTGN